MTTTDRIGQRLTSIFDAPLSPELKDRIDARVGRVVQQEPARRPAPAMRSLRRAALLAVAAVMAVGAGTIASDLFGGILFKPGWQTAWQNSIPIDQERRVDGHVIRLERGYADSTQVVLGWMGMLPDGMSRRPGAGHLTDDAGRAYRPSDGAGTDVTRGGATISTFVPVEALPAGETTFTFTLADQVTFTFTLPVVGGTDVRIGGTVIASDVAVTLREFRAGRTSLLAELSLELLQGAPDGESWVPIGHVEFGGRRMDLPAVREGEDGALLATAVEGVENAEGTWRVVIDELVGHDGGWPDNNQIRIRGPWVFEFELAGG